MANEIQTKFDSEDSFTITLNSLASGSGRASDAESNSSNRPGAKVSVVMTTGTSAPTANMVYTVYLLLDIGTIASDGWAGSDAAFTPINAHILGTIAVTASASTAFYGIFDTIALGPLGPTWGIAVKNDTDQNANSSGCAAYFRYHVPEIQ